MLIKNSTQPWRRGGDVTMTLFFLVYCVGMLTIATPCILPILPFVLARVDEPFKCGGLPMLLAMA